MNALAQRLAGARSWARWLLAFASGAVGALAMAPFGVLPAMVVSLTLAVWLLDGTRSSLTRKSVLAAALLGWFWGFGYFVAGLWWLGAAFLVEADEFAWAMPLGVLGLPAALAFFPALGFALSRIMWRPGPARILAFAAALTLSEWLRGHLFTGFPWNTIGMAFGQHLWLLQGASLIGLYGLTLLTILICAAPATLGDLALRRRWISPAIAAVGIVAIAAYGAVRVPTEAVGTLPGVKVRVMQPNLPQDAKFDAANANAIMQRYLGLSAKESADGAKLSDVTHLIWPESAFPFLLHREQGALAHIAQLLPEGVTLVTGAARMDDPAPGEVEGRFYNSIQAVDSQGAIVATYDKVHLVPFGEYVPGFVENLLRGMGLRQFVHIPGGFDAAQTRRALAIPGLPTVAASVCYEAIFPGAVLPDGPRPALILNVTNDAWFGHTPGPHQHFAQARMRTVEEGLPLVRAANTGISAVVDPFGRVIGSLGLGVEDVLDAFVPVAIPPTVYTKYGDRILLAMILLCLALALVTRPRRQPIPSSA